MLADWISGEEMKLTEIATKLREIASRIEVVAKHSACVGRSRPKLTQYPAQAEIASN